jgi:hypothetical protein
MSPPQLRGQVITGSSRSGERVFGVLRPQQVERAASRLRACSRPQAG